MNQRQGCPWNPNCHPSRRASWRVL